MKRYVDAQCIHPIYYIFLVVRLTMAGGDLNVRKSLKTQFSSDGAAAGAITNGVPRKTLMHKMSEGAMDLNDSKEMIGLQNSQFNLKQIEANLARLGRIHLILEHLITIKTNLNLENGEFKLRLSVEIDFSVLKIQHLPFVLQFLPHFWMISISRWSHSKCSKIRSPIFGQFQFQTAKFWRKLDRKYIGMHVRLEFNK